MNLSNSRNLISRLFLLVTACLCCSQMHAQRTTDKLDRGLVAVPSQNGAGNFVSWKIFGEEYYDTEFNLYRNGTKVNSTPLKVSCYTDAAGNSASQYQVAAVVRGVEQEKCTAVKAWAQQYMDIVVKPVYARGGTDVTSSHSYTINDIALADVTGDGKPEFLVKRLNGLDLNNVDNDSCFNLLECYDLQGNRLWWMDIGPNNICTSSVENNIVGYDWDGDGKAEVLMKGGDNMVIHTASGKVIEVGDMTADTRYEGITYTTTGKEYLLYMNGETGEPYVIMDYPLTRGSASDWGDSYGHRSTKFFFGAPFLDGRHPSIFLGRGIYTKHKMAAYDVDPETHQLTQRWYWTSDGKDGAWYAQGYHNYAIADVDEDGRDEIVYGSMVIDDNGKGLSTTGLGHGDAQHCGDFDPYRPGLEQFACNEASPAMNYRNATTSKIYYRLQGTSDDGRALCGNFTNLYPGAVGRSTQSSMISCVADKPISELGDLIAWGDLNFRIYWDGDLLDEVLNSPGTEREAKIEKPGTGRIFTSSGCNMINWTKNNPCAQGDIFGDWREEIVLRAEGNTRIRIYTTNIPTEYRNYTLWHDHQYRQAMVWQMCGYNQPPHLSYFLGEMEGITVAPPPLTMTGRTEVANGGTIGSSLDDKHAIVCEMNSTNITVADGAKPYITTFYVPSHVTGADNNSKIGYEYDTCRVSGGAFAGEMRLVKQGDGALILPNVTQTYTGETNVWAGALYFDGTLQKSNLWLNRHTKLYSNGGTFRNVKADYGSEIHVGQDGTASTINVDTLTLGFGSRLLLDIFSDGTADKVNAKAVVVEKKDWEYGPQYLTPVIEFKNNGDSLTVGRYEVAALENVTGDISDIKIEGLGNTNKTTLSMEDGKIYLVVEDIRPSGSIVWVGNESANWDLAKTANFTLTTEDGQQQTGETFVTGDDVTFNDNASSFNVNLTEDLEAASVVVDNSSHDYTFSGSGSLTGNTKLIKRGTGKLTVNLDNSYIGGTYIYGGQVKVKSLANDNLERGNLGAKKDNSTLNIYIGKEGTLYATSAVTLGTVLTADSGTVFNAADFVVNTPITGKQLIKTGSGYMKLNTNQPQLKNMVIQTGTVYCVSCTRPADKVEFRGGTLTENGGTSFEIYVPEGKAGYWNLAERAAYSNKVTGAGTLTVYCPVVKGSTWNATRTQIQCNLSQFTGTVVAKADADDGRFTFDTNTGIPNGTLEITDGVEVQNSGKTFVIGQLAGTGNLGSSCTFSNGSSVGNNTWKVNNAEDFSWSGKVTGTSVAFEKQGDAKMTVKGAWDNTGAVKVTGGELCVGSGGCLGTGSLTVSSGATLSGVTSTKVTLANSSYGINGTLRPGLVESAVSGGLDFGGKNVSIGTTGAYVMNARRCATKSGASGTIIEGIKNLTIRGKIVVNLVANYEPQLGDSIRLWECEAFNGSPTFELPTLADGLAWDTSRVSEGFLYVIDAATGIAGRNASMASPEDVYGLNGQLVRKNAQNLKGLPRGIYFWRGKKCVVK